jgi:hypothetical protein
MVVNQVWLVPAGVFLAAFLYKSSQLRRNPPPVQTLPPRIVVDNPRLPIPRIGESKSETGRSAVGKPGWGYSGSRLASRWSIAGPVQAAEIEKQFAVWNPWGRTPLPLSTTTSVLNLNFTNAVGDRTIGGYR